MLYRRALTLISAAAIAAPVAFASASEIRVGFTADALTLDPANHRKRETETIIRNMYDGLLTRDADMKVVSELAESFTQVSPSVFDFKLREGVTFHNGDPMTADDVVYTFTRLTAENAMNGQTSPRKSLLGPLDHVEKVDDRTVRFVMSSPWPLLPAMLPFQEVIQQKFDEANGAEGMAT